jgi:hypothetical protein
VWADSLLVLVCWGFLVCRNMGTKCCNSESDACMCVESMYPSSFLHHSSFPLVSPHACLVFWITFFRFTTYFTYLFCHCMEWILGHPFLDLI